MPGPAYELIEIYHGKYLDDITNKIPAAHIDPDKNGDISKAIEPGKPNFPAPDSVRITLENLDAEGNERYDFAWFDSNSRTQAEGAQSPYEMFLQIKVWGSVVFTGVYKSRSYGIDREQVTVQLKDVTYLIQNDQRWMLKPYILDEALLQFKYATGNSENELSDAYDLEGNSIDHEKLAFQLYQQINSTQAVDTEPANPAAPNPLYDSLYEHLFGTAYAFQATEPAAPSVGDTNSNVVTDSADYYTFVQISDNTILTRVQVDFVHTFEYEIQGSPSGDQHYKRKRIDYDLWLWHADNGNYTENGKTVLERGRFFEDDAGTNLSTGNTYRLTLWEPNHGHDDDILINLTDFQGGPIPGFIHGALYEDDGTRLDLVQGASGYDSFDVILLTQTAIEREYSHYFTGNADLFDISKAAGKHRRCFWADVLMTGWLGEKQKKIADIIVAAARQCNNYLYTTPDGKIAFHDRTWWKSYTDSNQLPAGSISLDDYPYQYHKGEVEDGGYESFSIEYPVDIIEINNVEQDAKEQLSVDNAGIRTKQSLRDKELSISNYRARISDLGVPNERFKGLRKVFRYSPGDASYAPAHALDDFVNDAIAQAVEFAESLTWPTRYIYPQLSTIDFPGLELGSYMHKQTSNAGEYEVYLVTRINYTPDLWKKCELQHLTTVQT